MTNDLESDGCGMIHTHRIFISLLGTWVLAGVVWYGRKIVWELMNVSSQTSLHFMLTVLGIGLSVQVAASLLTLFCRIPSVAKIMPSVMCFLAGYWLCLLVAIALMFHSTVGVIITAP